MGENAGEAPLLDGIEEEGVAEVLLDVGHAVGGNCEDSRDWQALGDEVVVEGEESLVLEAVGADHTDEGACSAVDAEVAAVATRGGELDYVGGVYAATLLV